MGKRSETQDQIEQAAERICARLETARRVLFITGAGLSADSGLPTYRGVGGLYNAGTTPEGIPFDEALSGYMMERDPALCWRHIIQVESACRGAEPNEGHRVIAELEQKFGEIWVLTQNVDGLHRTAGSSRIIDIHGDIRKLFCVRCEHREEVDDYSDLSLPPQCPECGGLVRPDVVLFGEMLPPAKVDTLRQQLITGFDAVFSVGTTSVFPYIAGPVVEASHRGVFTVEINPSDTIVTPLVDEKVATGATPALKAIRSRLPAGQS